MLKALIFDCDGVLVDTERDGHRPAFNRAFKRLGINAAWSPALYGDLLGVAGGKERMQNYFEQVGWPDHIGDKTDFIKTLHAEKTQQFMQIINSGELALRPGIARIVDEAIAAGVKLGVCSTSNLKAVGGCVNLLGAERRARFEFILAGDVVTRKKPDPEIYRLARQKLNLAAAECVVIEDSRNGLLAAAGAGMHCLVTTSSYTQNEDFSEAALIVPELGDGDDIRIGLADIQRLAAGPSASHPASNQTGRKNT
ncbi:HAD-IA family hydrolase [Exilibacterium tricleocarpae]|uniref:HAD-IA family hydrolase n=1 Tax=Exilibacterium tricleocarpae TaxID=2591008 RepID=A0A545TLY9_9GAMM|nr:HAD-IA family hydrolase [Exilibacterium tricleocarpae]TQV78196.1 HAD-IA family hydrolase [Exilibacterium tricleocarpae]